MVQIETTQALAEVEAIAAVEGVDGLFVGPTDMGLRLELQEEAGDLAEAIASVATAAEKHGVAWGLPAGTPELIAQYRGQGAQMLAFGGDFALSQVLADCSADFARALGE